MEEAITQVYPHARVITYADDGVVLHEDRQVREHCQELLKTELAQRGLRLNEAKSHIRHTLEGEQAGFACLGYDIRQYRVGKHQSGKGPRGHRRRCPCSPFRGPAFQRPPWRRGDARGGLFRSGSNQA